MSAPKKTVPRQCLRIQCPARRAYRGVPVIGGACFSRTQHNVACWLVRGRADRRPHALVLVADTTVLHRITSTVFLFAILLHRTLELISFKNLAFLPHLVLAVSRHFHFGGHSLPVRKIYKRREEQSLISVSAAARSNTTQILIINP